VTELTFSSRAVDSVVHVNVLTPVGYDPSGATRYPVLYLLHGHGGRYSDWVNHGVADVVAGMNAIVVMPEGGYDGFYSDWYGTDLDGHTSGSAPAWETFHIRELLPWIDLHYPTIADRQGRAVAGLSIGGFGSMSYAARHPDLFAAAAAFSGTVDPDLDWPLGPIGQGIVANLPDRKPPDNCIWGDPVTQSVVWRDHDPTELAGNLRGISLFLASGNGLPGTFDNPARPNPGSTLTEQGIWQMNQAFDRALAQAGIAHVTDFYGNGTHDWPYWLRDLRTFLPQLETTFAAKPSSLPMFDFETARAPFSIQDWMFTPHRDVTEMTYLTKVGPLGLDARGSGTLHVDTAPSFVPFRSYRLSRAAIPSLVVADPGGRLHFDVDLGPSHETQQYIFGPQVEATFAHAHITISPH
jgi:S-formylglutathione hydrolase FrmB